MFVREPKGREINIVVNGENLPKGLGLFLFYDKNGKVDIKKPGAVDVVCNYFPDGGGESPNFPVVFFMALMMKGSLQNGLGQSIFGVWTRMLSL